MAFYTADWIKQLIKEDHKEVQKQLNTKGKDFRSYIDATLPFSLYLDIDNIRKEILNPNAKFIQDLAFALGNVDPGMIIKELDKAYVKVINFYASNFTSINSAELENKLNALALGIEQGNIKYQLQNQFKSTYVISNVTRKNKSVLLIFPKFRTISDRFGRDFREHFDYSVFSDYIDDKLGDSPRNIVERLLSGNFGTLQNIGHVEVDVLSSQAGSSEVKRGLVSPRLLQALLELPKGTKPENLARKFSKETGQAETRIVVRKKFNSTKLVLEMLIESGLMIGSLESQKTNLDKAKLEKSFGIGANLSRRLVEDKNLLLNLVTSKSITQYLVDSVMSSLKGKKEKDYSSNTEIKSKTPVTKEKVSLPKSKSTPSTVGLADLTKVPRSNLTNLQMLLNQHLQDVISANMGNGNDRKVLNYRTGRLAASARVERLTQSREGMVTAFYTYMKNPYATFSEGGRQQYPKSRDPKLLISGAIREIAATQAVTRLRSVLV